MPSALLFALSPLVTSLVVRTTSPETAFAAKCLRKAGDYSLGSDSVLTERTFADGTKDSAVRTPVRFPSVPYRVAQGHAPPGADVATWFIRNAKTVVSEEHISLLQPELRFSSTDLRSPVVVLLAYRWWISGLLTALLGWLLMSPWRSAPRSASRLRELAYVVGLASVPAFLTAGATAFLLVKTGAWGVRLFRNVGAFTFSPAWLAIPGAILVFYGVVALQLRLNPPLPSGNSGCTTPEGGPC